MGQKWIGAILGGMGLVLALGACSNNDDFGEGIVYDPAVAANLTTISSLSQATSTAAALEQVTLAGINSGRSIRGLTAPVQRALSINTPNQAPKFSPEQGGLQRAAEPALAAPLRLLDAELQKARAFAVPSRAPQAVSQTYVCSGAGSITYSGTLDAEAGTYDFSVTAASCREGGAMTNGPMRLTGTYNPATQAFTATATFGSGNRQVESSGDYQVFNFDGSNLYAIDTLDLSVSTTSSVATVANGTTFQYDTTATGAVRSSDFLSSFDVIYSGLHHVSTVLVSTTPGVFTGSDLVNGMISERWTNAGTSYNAGIKFTDYAVTWAESPAAFEFSANGHIETSLPGSLCADGSFNIATLAPLRHDVAADHFVSGHIVINDTTHAEILADGSVKVTLSDGTSQTFATLDEFQGTCDISTLGNESNLVQVDWSADPTPIVTTGSNLLATLVWIGGETSDMDTHLTHFAETAPTAGSTPDWHIYYADKTSGGVGALDIDDVQGFGPEHITLPTLPPGYYVLYIDPYSLDADPSATIMVSLRIGDTAYGFPSYTFLPSDTADHRIADVRVDASGTVTLLPPDGSLPLAAPAFAPRLKLPAN